MKKILILFGGPTTEHLISCKSARGVAQNIDRKKFDVSMCGISKNGVWYSYNGDLDLLENGNWLVSSANEIVDNVVEYVKNFDVVFPIIHGCLGEDGSLAGFFETFGVRYVGSGVLSHSVGFDKYYTKLVCKGFGIPQIDYVIIGKKERGYLKKVEEKLEYPVIVKPSRCGSSIGISVANNKRELGNCLKEAFNYDDKVIVEKYIKNRREFECGILEDKKLIVSSVGEIVVNSEFYDYEEKYVNKATSVIPAFIEDSLSKEIKAMSKVIFDGIGCKGLARVDFIYDEDMEKLYFNEINTIPGFTEISMYSKVFINDGISYKELISKLINNA